MLISFYPYTGLHITMTNAYTKGDACFDEPFTVRCEAVKRGSAKNSTNHQTQLKCQVHYSDNSANTDVQKINFTDFSVCIRD
ncbi:hypothetical protein OS493_011672 [Desmophyllum pertusum]|uniref:Uncharacterized protein n=1 Tax=Desmophyllum pertusum TaxID=174260 RepID=A0A9X0CHG2_9CNID|nr:hypothetical protein OS493_011672 [Desmophyllum pertusum]